MGDRAYDVLSREEFDQGVVRLYTGSAQQSMVEIARMYSCSTTAVRSALKRQGITPRGPGRGRGNQRAVVLKPGGDQ